MNEQVQKELEKNYGKVQKKEFDLNNNIDKLNQSFEKEVKANQTELNNDLKAFKAVDKEIKDSHKESEKKLKETQKDNLAANKVKVTEANKKHQTEEEKLIAKYQKEIDRLEKAKAKIEANNEKLVASTLKAFDKDVAANKKEQEKLQEESNKMQALLQEKFDEKLAKYNEKVVSLNEKRETQLQKLNDSFTSRNEKLEEGIKSQREKSDKQLADYVPIFTEKIEQVEELISNEQSEYETKLNDIKDTLQSKLDRRNKFLEKAENENDTKAAKIQRKEIKQLQQSADKEIKSLEKAHAERKVDLNNKKKEVLKNNLEQKAAVEREFVNFKEDNLMQIEVNKVTLADEITQTKLNTELKLQDELAKYNEFLAKHNEKAANELKKSNLKIEEQADLAVKLQIQFDLINKTNELQYLEDLALNEKDVQITELEHKNNLDLNNLVLEEELAKLASEKDIQEKESVKDLTVNDLDANNKYHQNDASKLTSTIAEFNKNQDSFTQLYEKRAEELNEFEAVEINNRFTLKQKFIEAQLKRVEANLKTHVTEIEKAFKQETALYNKEVEKIASEDQKAVIKFKQDEEAAIQELVDTKKELDPKEDKNRIIELDQEIDERKTAYRNELKQKEDFVFAKTQTFQAQIELAEQRKTLALQEAKDFAELETNDLNASLETLTQLKEQELADSKARYDKTVANTVNYKNLATTRNQKAIEENQVYLQTRVTKENSEITDTKQDFETYRNEGNTNLQSLLQQKEETRLNFKETLKNNAMQKEQELEAKINDFKQQSSDASQKEQDELTSQSSAKKANENGIESTYNNKVNEIDTLLKKQDQENQTAQQSVIKRQDAETKQLEAEKLRLKKEYDIELKKALQIINQKLEQDIKAL